MQMSVCRWAKVSLYSGSSRSNGMCGRGLRRHKGQHDGFTVQSKKAHSSGACRKCVSHGEYLARTRDPIAAKPADHMV